MTATWTPFTWRQMPALTGKVADENDFQRWVAVFHQHGHPIEPVDMCLPQPAVLTIEGEAVAVVIVQAERTHKTEFSFETFGAVDSQGRQYVFSSPECRLVGENDPQWLQLVAQGT